MKTIKDETLGAFELHSSILIDNNIFQSTQWKRFTSGLPPLTAAGIKMKRAINVKSTPAPGFSKGSGSVCGKKPPGFFGLRENVSFSVRRFRICVFNIYSGMR